MELIELITNMWLIVKSGLHSPLVIFLVWLAALVLSGAAAVTAINAVRRA